MFHNLDLVLDCSRASPGERGSIAVIMISESVRVVLLEYTLRGDLPEYHLTIQATERKSRPLITTSANGDSLLVTTRLVTIGHYWLLCCDSKLEPSNADPLLEFNAGAQRFTLFRTLFETL